LTNQNQPKTLSSKKSQRHISGILLLDKPHGVTSNDALQQVKRLFNAAKAGHTGILDPLATGVLPICFGEATKFSQFLLDADKGYQVTMQLGTTTTTGDAEGEILTKQQSAISSDAILQLLPQFKGQIMQTPPMYSALKIDGQPLYKLARAGKTVERKPRQVNIHTLQLTDFNAQTQQASLELTCSKGTYVRTLVEDLGQLLGCGAYVVQLCRHLVGDFKLANTHKMADLEALSLSELDELVLPIDAGFSYLPELQVSEKSAFYWLRGNPIRIPNAPKFGLMRIKSNDGKFLGMGEINLNGLVAPKRIIKL